MTAEFPCTSVDVATGYRRNPCVFAASGMAYGTSTENAMVVATARAVVLPVEISVVPTIFNRRKSAAIAMAVSAETSVAFSTATRGPCHGNAAITADVRKSSRQFPRQFSRTSNRRIFHGHPRPPAANDACYDTGAHHFVFEVPGFRSLRTRKTPKTDLEKSKTAD